jgi:hypothetical protein
MLGRTKPNPIEWPTMIGVMEFPPVMPIATVGALDVPMTNGVSKKMSRTYLLRILGSILSTSRPPCGIFLVSVGRCVPFAGFPALLAVEVLSGLFCLALLASPI